MPAHLKPMHLLRTRKKAATRATLYSDEPPRVRPPMLPRGYREWRPATGRWWADVWASEASADYLSADMWGLVILAILIDQFDAEPSVGLAAEIRLQARAYGLTPLDRKRLGLATARVR